MPSHEPTPLKSSSPPVDPEETEEAPPPGCDDELRVLVEHSPVAMAMLDRDLRYLHASRRWRADHRLADRAWRGVSHFELFPDAPESTRAAFRRALAGQAVHFQEDLPGGPARSILRRNYDVEPWQDSSGATRALMVVATDITAQHRAEHALWESEANFRGFFESLHAGAAQIDARGRFIRVNDRFCAITGYTRKELLGGIGPLDLTLPEDRDRDTLRIERLLRGESFELEKRYLRKDGSVIWVHVLASAILDADGRVLCSAAVVEDISDRRAAGEELIRSRELLAKAEALSNTGAMALDLATGIWTISDQCRSMFGCSSSRLTPDQVFAIVHPDDREAVQRAFEEHLAGCPYRMEHRIVRLDDGRERIVQASGELVRDAEGRVAGTYGVVQDITERRLLEKQARERSELLNAVVEQLAGPICLVRGSDLRYILVNHAFEAISPGKNIIGRTPNEVWAETGIDLDAIGRRVLETGEIFQAVDQPIFIQRTPGGVPEQAYFTWSLARVRLPDQQDWGLLSTGWETTDRWKAEERLRQSEARSRMMFESIPALAWHADDQGQAIFFNQRWYDYTGLEPAASCGFGYRQAVHPADLDLLRERIQRALRRGESDTIELRIRRKDGEYRWHLTRTDPVRELGGRIGSWVGCAVDIQDRKRAAAALAESEERLRLVQQAARIGSFSLDIASGAATWTPQTEALYGLAPGQFAGSRAAWEQMVDPEDRVRMVAWLNETVQADASTEAEFRVRWPDGSVHWIFSRCRTIRGPCGLAGRLMGVSLDITPRKEIEAALREREGELQRVLDTAATGLARCNRDMRYLFANPPFARLVGVPLDKIIGHRVADVIGETAWEVIRPYVDQVLGGKRMEYDLDIPLTGGVRSIHVITNPDRDAQGKVQGWFVSLTDISERKALEREVLRVSEAERRRMAADLHDDLCQKLIAIGCETKALQRRLEKEAHALAPALGAVSNSISEAAAHTRKIAHGINPVVPGGGGLMDALQGLARSTEEHHRLTCRFECRHPVLVPDPVVSTQLYLIAQEAVRNAVTHSGASRIDVNLAETASEIRLAVTDNGCGLPPESDSGPGLGLRGMRYRAGLIHARLNVRVPPWGGTEIACRLSRNA